MTATTITNVAELEALYGEINPISLRLPDGSYSL